MFLKKGDRHWPDLARVRVSGVVRWVARPWTLDPEETLRVSCVLLALAAQSHSAGKCLKMRMWPGNPLEK